MAVRNLLCSHFAHVAPQLYLLIEWKYAATFRLDMLIIGTSVFLRKFSHGIAHSLPMAGDCWSFSRTFLEAESPPDWFYPFVFAWQRTSWDDRMGGGAQSSFVARQLSQFVDASLIFMDGRREAIFTVEHTFQLILYYFHCSRGHKAINYLQFLMQASFRINMPFIYLQRLCTYPPWPC